MCACTAKSRCCMCIYFYRFVSCYVTQCSFFCTLARFLSFDVRVKMRLNSSRTFNVGDDFKLDFFGSCNVENESKLISRLRSGICNDRVKNMTSAAHWFTGGWWIMDYISGVCGYFVLAFETWQSATFTDPAYLWNFLSTQWWRTHIARIIVGWMCTAKHRTIFNRILVDAWSAISHERLSVHRIFLLAGEVYRSKCCNVRIRIYIRRTSVALFTTSVTQCKWCEMWLTEIEWKLVRRQLSAQSTCIMHCALCTGDLFSTICCSMDSTTHEWTVRIYGFILVIEFAKCTLHSLFRPWIDSLSSHAFPNKSKISSKVSERSES